MNFRFSALALLMMNTPCLLSAAAQHINHSPSTHPEQGVWQRFTTNVQLTWNSPQNELYVPVNTWHNRWTYDDEKLARYNEMPWGLGYGQYYFDRDGGWHALYTIAFLDSNRHIQPIGGYGYEERWSLDAQEHWHFGAGFTASITARHEYYYIPLPIVLPLLSIGYKRLSLQTTYIPCTYNNGNVLFTWIRWQF